MSSYPTLTHSHDVELELRLVLILLSLSPSMLIPWLRKRYPGVEQRLPIGWYGLLLAMIAGVSYWVIGEPPRLLGNSLSPWFALALGLALGILATGVDLGVSRAFGRLRRRRKTVWRRARWAPGANLADVPTDVEVVWRLHDEGPPWRSGWSDLMLVAVLEECIYRQTLLALLMPAVGGILLLPAVLSTLSFGLIHSYFGLGSVVSKWIIGAILTAAVLAGAGLLAAIIAHCVLNTAYVLLRQTAAAPVASPAAGERR